MDYAILGLLILCLVGIFVLIFSKKKGDQNAPTITQDDSRRIVKDECARIEQDVRNTVENSNLRQAQSLLTSFTETNKLVIQNIERLITDVNKNSEKTAEIINNNLEKINKSVNEQLAEN